MTPQVIDRGKGSFRAFVDGEYLAQFGVKTKDIIEHRPITIEVYDDITKYIESIVAPLSA